MPLSLALLTAPAIHTRAMVSKLGGDHACMRFENTCLLVHGSLVVVVRSAACTALDRRQQMRARRSQPRKLTGSQAVEQPSPKAQRQRVIIVDPSGGFLGGSNREHAVGQKGTMGGGGSLARVSSAQDGLLPVKRSLRVDSNC